MGKQIVKQPNGKFALWSSVVDDFTVIDYENTQEIIDDFVEQYRAEIGAKVNAVVEALEKGEKPYYQFTMSFEECVARIKEVHGSNAESLAMINGNVRGN